MDPHGPDPDDADDDAVEINLRPAPEVADRLAILGAVCRRAYLELGRPEDLEADDPEAERFDLAAWLREEGLAPLLSPAERRLVETRLRRLAPEEAEAASWGAEALAALAWALGLLAAAPPYDEPAEPAALLRLVPTPWDKTAPFRAAAALRPEAEIAAERERAELWHWRAGIAALALATVGREARNLAAIVRDVAREAAAAGLFPAPADGDFPVRGGPYRALADPALSLLATLAAERLRALNWLCGHGDDWDHVPLEI